MQKNFKNSDKPDLNEIIKKPLIKYPLIAASSLATIWVLGKSAKILAGFIRGIRDLGNALKGH